MFSKCVPNCGTDWAYKCFWLESVPSVSSLRDSAETERIKGTKKERWHLLQINVSCFFNMSSAAGSKSCDFRLNQVTILHFYSWMWYKWYKSYRKCVAEPESFNSGLGSSSSRGEKAEISGDQVVELQSYDLVFKCSQEAVLSAERNLSQKLVSLM